MLAEGDRAPDFELRGVWNGEFDSFRLSASAEAGENVLLSFYSFDFNPVCTAGTCSLRDTDWFSLTPNLRVFGVSGDAVYAHRAFAREHDIAFPLLSDTDRSVAREYGVLAEEVEGMPEIPERSVFLIDSDRTVRFATAIDVDTPADVDITPVEEAVHALAD